MTNMRKTSGITKTGRPYMVFDNVFSDEEAENMLLEMELIMKPNMRRDNTGGVESKNTNAVFHHEVFVNPEASHVYRNTRKYIGTEMLGALSGFHWAFSALVDEPIHESVQLLYYENNDSYGQHTDLTLMTILYWLYREPKGFKGGDIILDGDAKVECKHNRALAMSIKLPHEVVPVEYTATEPNRGRYCISNFYNFYVGE